MDDGAAQVLDAELARAHHLLVLAQDVLDEEVEALVLSRFEGGARRDSRTVDLIPGAWLTGPWVLDDAARRDLELPVWAACAYLTRCPIQRGGPVPPELRGLGGILDAFAAGPPVEDELEVVKFLQAAARRLAGGVRVAATTAVLAPDPDADVDLRVHSEVWLHPDALLAVLRPALSELQLLTAAGPAPLPGPAVELPPGAEGLDEGERAWLHAEANAFDARALGQDPVLETYGAVHPFEDGGSVTVVVEAEGQVPLVLEGLDWTRSGLITYELRWHPADPEAYFTGSAGADVLAQREQARALVEAAARRLLGAVGGESTDDDGFLVDPGS